MVTLTLQVPILAALIEVEGVRVSRATGGRDALAACADRYHAAAPGGSPSAVPGIDAARRLFRALGIDPTKRRPSSEALLNRALKGKPMPHVSTLVDVGNWCSLDMLLPLGLYDADAIGDAVTLRLGRPGEAYESVAGRTLSLAGRYLLADAAGPFGSPITDSMRSRVTASTTAAVVVVYAPADYDQERLRDQAETLRERTIRLCGGRGVNLLVLRGEDGRAG